MRMAEPLAALLPILWVLPGCVPVWPGKEPPADTGFALLPIELHPRCTTVYPENLSVPADPAEHFVIATVFDHSLATHVARYRSVQLAVAQANGNDGLDGRDFVVVHCTNEEGTGLDDLDKTEASVEVAEWLARDARVTAIVGPAASSRAEAVFNVVSYEYGTLIVSPSATSPSLTPIDGLRATDRDPGLFWRTAPPDDIQSAAIAWDMRTHFDPAGIDSLRPAPSQRVAVVYQWGAYGEGLAATFGDAFAADGGSIVGFPFGDAGGRADAVAEVAAGGFDEVLFASSDANDVSAFVLGSVPLEGFDGLPIFLTDAARNADVLDALAGQDTRLAQVRGTVVTQPSGPIYDSFAAAYAAEYGGEDPSVHSYTAQSYDAAWLVMLGHAWAVHQEEDITGLSIARGLRQLSSGDPVELRPTSWNLAKASFREGTAVDIVGASGDLDYDDAGETIAPIDVWTVVPTGDDFEVETTFAP